MFHSNYGECKGEEMIATIREMVDASSSMKFKILDDGQIVIAICTPLMQRVHSLLKHSGEVVFMDASSNMDRYNCSVFLLLTHSCVGGLPIGVLVTTSETESTITAALEVYKSMLPGDCFGGRGLEGPQLFLTDDCKAEHKAINAAFPQSVLLLCVFHVLQATWRWLWNAANKVPKERRPEHLQQMKRLIYASSRDEMERLFEESIENPTLQK